MKCISHYYIELDERTDINFIFEKCAVDTCSAIPRYNEENETKSEFGYLRLSIEFELKNYE